VEWRKSCCHVCPFANGNAEMLTRFREFPDRAADALLVEHVCLALNPRGTLYRDRTLRSVIEADGNAAALAAFHRLAMGMPWAVYHLRRIYRSKGNADRSIRKLDTGTHAAMLMRLARAAGPDGVELVQGCDRVTLRTPTPGAYPALDEFLALAPATADDKTSRAGFDRAWAGLVGQERPLVA